MLGKPNALTADDAESLQILKLEFSRMMPYITFAANRQLYLNQSIATDLMTPSAKLIFFAFGAIVLDNLILVLKQQLMFSH
jgi:hypothetical protein